MRMAENSQFLEKRPPYSNRGVYPLIVEGSPLPISPTFDAYCASVYAHHDTVVDCLFRALSEAGEGVSLEDGPPIRFYTGNTLLLDENGRRLAQVRFGGNPHPFVEAKGWQSPAVAQALRDTFEHSPSRIDSAFDRAAPGLFEQLVALAQDFEQRFGIRLDWAGAAVSNPDRGTTVYLGSRKSAVFVRIYQKGLKLAEEMGLVGEAIPDSLRHWVRIELEFKPQKKRAKEIASGLSPLGLWGVSPWTRQFAMEALSIEAERVTVTERRESDHQRALRFMAQQYRGHLEQLLRECGGDYSQAMAVLVDLADLAPARAA